ncbi:hypothetical protein QUA08_08075, partial [Microcoleus sp. T3B2]
TLGTGKMPIPQQINFLVEQASCLFLITDVTDVRKKEEGRRKKEEGEGKKTLGTGKMPIPQQINFLVEQASCLFLMAITYRDSKAPCNFWQSAFWAIDYL